MMTVEELRAELLAKIEQASIDVETRRAALRQAEIEQAFLQGQLHMLNKIRIEAPIYTNGIEEPS